MVYTVRKSLLLLSLFLLLAFVPVATHAQDAPHASTLRKVRVAPRPEYPVLAHKLSIHGTVREVNVVGGNPILVDTCVNTVKKWRYEPTGKESLEPVRISFN